MVTVQTRFDCTHTTSVEVQIDPEVGVPEEVRGLGKCCDCMEEAKLIPITGVQPQAGGRLVLDSIFWMPVE